MIDAFSMKNISTLLCIFNNIMFVYKIIFYSVKKSNFYEKSLWFFFFSLSNQEKRKIKRKIKNNCVQNIFLTKIWFDELN